MAGEPGLVPETADTQADRRGPRRLPDRARTILLLALGLVWLLDAALQFQLYMFTSSFVTNIIEPAAAGNPSFLASSMTWAAHLMQQHIAIYNALFATTQLLIALGLFVPRTRKLALGGSVAYSLVVWYLGEGLGGVMTGASPLSGVPGGVVLYALLGLLLWPSDAGRDQNAAAPALNGRLGRTGSLTAWAVLWLSFSYYALLPANRAPGAMAHLFAVSGSGEPGWVSSVDTALAGAIGNHGTGMSLLFAVLSIAVALGIFVAPLCKLSISIAVALSLLIWVAEGFGAIFTGRGTDPNTGLLLILLAACYWPYAKRQPGGDSRPVLIRT
jgi:hypothetical protein